MILPSSGSEGSDAAEVAAVVLATVAAVASWALVNAVLANQYARLYHFEVAMVGSTFGGKEPPASSDFADVAFTVGASTTETGHGMVVGRSGRPTRSTVSSGPDSIVISPPCRSTMIRREMSRPKPVPFPTSLVV